MTKKLFALFAAALAQLAFAANFVDDTFTDTDGTLLTAHTGETGASWTELNVLGNTTPTVDADIVSTGDAAEAITGSPTASDYVGYKASGTPASADYEVTARVSYAGAIGFSNAWSGPVMRCPTAATAITGYACLFDPDGAGVQVWRLTGSGGTQLSSKIGSGQFSAGSYDITVAATGTTITGSVQRVSDGNWLTSGGTWQASETTFYSGFDATYSAAGVAALWIQGRASGSNGLSIDRFTAGDGSDASLSVSPTTGETGTTPTITLTGVGTSWESETPTGLFTVSGGSGSAIGTPTITSDTEATATLTVGSAAGSLTITDTSTSETATFTATLATESFGVDDSSIYWSPYNWFSEGAGALQSNNVRSGAAYAWSNQRGAYMKFRATVGSSGSISLTVNTASLSGLASNGCPTIAWTVGNGAVQTQLLAYSASEYTVDLGTGLSADTYDVFVWFRSVYITQEGDEWTGPANRVQISSVELSSGGSLSAPDVRPNTMLVYGDSITEGDLNQSGTRGVASQDALQTYGAFAAAALDAEVGIVGFYGEDWAWMATSWDEYSDGNSRLYSSALSPEPDYLVVNYGENGSTNSSTVTSTLGAVSAAAPGSDIFVLVPFSGQDRSALQAATLPDNATLLDLAPPEMESGALFWSFDGQHPTERGHANLGALLAREIYDAVGSGTATSFGTFGGGRL